MEKQWRNLILIVITAIALIFIASLFMPAPQPLEENNISGLFALSGITKETFDEAIDSFDYAVEDQKLTVFESELKKMTQSGTVSEKNSAQILLKAVDLEKNQTIAAKKILSVEEQSILDACKTLSQIDLLQNEFLDVALKSDSVENDLKKLPSAVRVSVNADNLFKESDNIDYEITKIIDFCIVASNFDEETGEFLNE